MVAALTTSNKANGEFEKLVARTERQAYNIAYRMTGNRDDAEDLTQEAYLRAYRSLDKYNRALPFENWFFRILSNLFVDSLRKKPKQTPLSLEQPIGENEDLLLEIPDKGSDPQEQLMNDLMGEDVQRAIDTLRGEFRTAVILCDVDGRTYEEIALIMGTTIGTVRSRIHRGRKKLRPQLQGHMACK